MKKYILVSISIALGVVLSAYNVYQSQTKVAMSDIMLENIEALSSGEATPAPKCYIDSPETGRWKMDYYCNKETNEEYIYPCPQNADFGYYDETQKDRCTK